MQIKLPDLGHFYFLPPQRALLSGYAMLNFQRKYKDCYYCWRYHAYFPKIMWNCPCIELNTTSSPHCLAASSSIQDQTFENKISLESGFFSVLVLILPFLRKHLHPPQCQWLYGASLQKLGVPPVSKNKSMYSHDEKITKLCWFG